jgi:hypothetical protein
MCDLLELECGSHSEGRAEHQRPFVTFDHMGFKQGIPSSILRKSAVNSVHQDLQAMRRQMSKESALARRQMSKEESAANVK